jgi:hypothetical protein
MKFEAVEIFSDKTNAAVMRHPGRAFPGVLIQGDSLNALCQKADILCSGLVRSSPEFSAAKEIRNTLWEYMTHYKATLIEHGMALPFSESSIDK